MNEKILFIFEGLRGEVNVSSQILRSFIEQQTDAVIKCTYNTNIYRLYEDIVEDDFLNVVEILKNRSDDHDEIMNYTSDSFSQIYLFFDYDGQDQRASFEKISHMLTVFNNETEHGKLYISYPMLESIRYITGLSNSDLLINNEIAHDSIGNFKSIVHNNTSDQVKNTSRYTGKHWGCVVEIHCKRASEIVGNGSEIPPPEMVTQEQILERQRENKIESNKIFIISSFPLMILDYYGKEKLELLLAEVSTT